MSPAGLVVVAVFGLAALLGAAGLFVSWPVLRDPKYRARILVLLVLVTAGAVCLVIGQKLLDDVGCHAYQHQLQR